jgi:hypothetical protein
MDFVKLRLALILFAATLLFVPPRLSAQTNGALAADPFVKKDAPAPPQQKGPVVNIVLTFEFYEINQTEGAQLLQQTSSVQARYDQLGDLVKRGKARLDALISGVQEPGQQSTLEQCDTFPYAIAFQATSMNSQVSLRATDFKRRNLGYRVIFKSNESADQKSCYVNLFPEHTRLAGIVDQSSLINNLTCVVPQPVFNAQRVNVGALLFPYGPIWFVNTFNPPPLPVTAKKGQASGQPAEPQMGLIFARASRIRYEPTAETVEPFAPLDVEISIYSMERGLARQVLAEPPKGDSTYRAVQSLLTAGQAKLEHVAVIRSPVGVKSNTSEVAEKIYTTGGDDQWITQDLGFNAEVRTDLIGNGSLLSFDVTQCQFLTDLGSSQAEGLAGALTATQPIFQVQSLTTKLNSALGTHTLLGTLNRAGDTGIPGQSDDGRVWLAFIQAANAKP